MKFSSFSGPVTEIACDLLAVPVFQEKPAEHESVAALDRRMDGLLARLIEEERFTGKLLSTLTVHTHGKVGAQRIMLIGLGPSEKSDAVDLRHVGAKLAKAARGVSAKTIALQLPEGERALQAAAEGMFLGRYRYDRYMSEEKKPDLLESAVLLTSAPQEVFTRTVGRAQIIATAIANTRDLVNEPAGDLTPTRLAAEAKRLADAHGLELTVLGPKECKELGMGMYLAVSQGSEEEPRFIHMVYRPRTPAKKRVALVGKGVTFDSGGLSLKPSAAMEDMKVDMAGAAAVINAVAAAAQLGVNVEVHAFAACTENMPSGRSYKLGDVLRSMAGKTVEINNTDAEGRLTLGDAITYAKRQQPHELFDFATLTGACMIALGPHTAGVMGNNPDLIERFLAAAKVAGEDMWHLPLIERLKDHLKSDVADMRNTGERHGGALTAGLFLREFAGETPWVHVDIAGPASADKEYGATPKGGTGYAVATIVEYLSRQ
jgi:leucyl aminopeptidase